MFPWQIGSGSLRQTIPERAKPLIERDSGFAVIALEMAVMQVMDPMFPFSCDC